MTDEMIKGMMDYFNRTQENINANALAVKATNENIAAMVGGINDIKALINGVAEDVKTTNDCVYNLETRVDVLENEVEIKTTQKEAIRRAASKRVYELLGDDPMDHTKYSRIFYKRLYQAARSNAGLGCRIEETMKKDYDRVINYIRNWSPATGCDQLKLEADGNAERRRNAREQGYDA